MRQRLTGGACFVRVLFLVLSFMCLIALPPAVMAAPVQAEAPYRILFPKHSAAGLWRGPYARQNEAAVQRLARLVGLWPEASGYRFIFVARRPACAARGICDAAHLMWQRVNAVMAKLKSIVNRSKLARNRLRFDLFGSAFLDELAGPVSLPRAPAGAEALDLRLLASPKTAPKTANAPPCPWQVSLLDPLLPLPLDGRAVTAPAGRTMPISHKARIRVAYRGAPNAIRAGVWENGQGFRRAAAQLLTGRRLSGLPLSGAHGHVSLHLLAGRQFPAALQAFLNRLTGHRFTWTTPVPPPLSRRRAVISKGLGDHPEYFAPGSLVRRPPGTGLTHCRFTFMPVPGL